MHTLGFDWGREGKLVLVEGIVLDLTDLTLHKLTVLQVLVLGLRSE